MILGNIPKDIQGNLPKEALYVSVDNIWFSRQSTIRFGKRFLKNRAENTFLIDRVHKYENWSQEIKIFTTVS